VDVVSSGVADVLGSLRLPFWLVDDTPDGVAVSAGAIVGDVVTLTATGHGLPVGGTASVTIDPSGADNTMIFTAVEAGVGGNSISVEIVGDGDNGTTVEVEVAGNEIVIRPSISKIIVSGGAGTFGTAANGEYVYMGEVNGRVWYCTDPLSPAPGSGFPTGHQIWYDGVGWIMGPGGSALSGGTGPIGNPVPLNPLEVASWSDEAGEGSVFVLTGGFNTAQEVIDAVNADVLASALVTASASGAATGAVGVVAQTLLSGGAGGDGSAWLEVTGIGFSNANPNGFYLVTPTDANTLTYEIDGSGNETYTISGNEYARSRIDDGSVDDVFGSCVFSDPNNGDAEFAILAFAQKARKVSLADGTTTDIDYPTGGEISGPVDLLQCFDKVILFREGLPAWEWYGSRGRSITAGARATNVVTLTVKAHGLTAGDSVTVTGIGYASNDPNGTFVVASVTDDTFTYADSGGDETFTFNGDEVLSSSFTVVKNGAYTQPQAFNVRQDNVSVADGEVTLTVTGNTTFAEGDRIRIFGSEIAHFVDFVGREYSVSSASTTSIKFYLGAGNYTSAGTSEFLYVGKAVSIGSGFGHMPGPAWGNYFQRRLWIPYAYDSVTLADRAVSDEILFSDILDSDTYDLVLGQLRITAGIADSLVGMHPFYEDRMLVFMRNSIHVVAGAGTDSLTVKELTREVGALARKTIASQGNAVFFLSDNGVYGIGFVDEYNLRGVEKPLSEPIQPLIDRINKDLAADSIGIYFDNRYWLAVPLDSAVGANDAAGNNAMLVFNMLNQAWESVDTWGDTNFLVSNLFLGRAGTRNALYGVTQSGGIHIFNALNENYDRLSVNTSTDNLEVPIESSLTSRGFMLGSIGRKRFTQAGIVCRSGTVQSELTIGVSTQDPDSTQVSTNLSASLGMILAADDSADARIRVGGIRGHHATVTVTPTAGRPRIRSITMQGTETNRQTISQQ
jgi:hypothetical protein